MNLFVLSRSNHASHQEKSSHLHANRPSDQLSCRAPRYTLVAELSVTTHLRAHFEGVHKIELATQDKKNLSVTPASQLFPSGGWPRDLNQFLRGIAKRHHYERVPHPCELSRVRILNFPFLSTRRRFSIKRIPATCTQTVPPASCPAVPRAIS